MAVFCLKKLWMNRKKELLLGAVIILLTVIALLVNSKSIVKKTGRIMNGKRNPEMELKKKQDMFATAIEEERQLLMPIFLLKKQRTNFWLPEYDGNPQYGMRKRIETAARDADLKLKTFGAIQNMKITEGLTVYQINIMADTQYDNILRFMFNISKGSPNLLWKNLTITPDNTLAPNFLILNGTLQITVLNVPGIAEKLWGQENARNVSTH